MSYPPLSDYGRYYNTSSGGHTSQNGYGAGRGTSESTTYSTQSAYHTEPPQQQYNSSGYDWSNQNQQSYDSTSQPAYANDSSWKDGSRQDTTYDYRRETSTYATQVAAGNHAQGYYSTAPTESSAQNSGLNNLAYASGLDNATTQRHASRPQQSSKAVTSNYSTTPSTSNHNRVKSPLDQQTQRYNQLPAPNSAPRTAGSTNSPNLANAAAVALAGAVSRRYQQTPPVNTPSTKSSVTSSVVPAPAHMPQRASSPYNSGPQTSVRPPGHAQSTTRPQNQVQISDPGIRGGSTQTTKSNRNQQHARAPSQPSQRATEPPATQPTGSIASLVTAQPTNVPRNSFTPEVESQQPMPTYIDPSQVFNPYHKEHEKRRREAAIQLEAEAKRKQAATAASDDTGSEKPAANSGKKATKDGKEVTATVSDRATPVPNEANMAAEMKTMMEKMKEFRSKDPSLFQKLWDDMRKGGANPAAAPNAAQSPSPKVALSTTLPEKAPAEATISTPAPMQASEPATVRQQAPRPRKSHHASSPHPHANGYRVVVEDNTEGLPDLGRFPAERRIRASYNKPEAAPGTPTNIDPALVSKFPSTVPGLPASGLAPTQPLPPKNPSGGTIWPEEKRTALAEAAVKALNSTPENVSIDITSSEIKSILEQNPSYIDLCGLLEKRGLRFHRGHFARQLLSNVPDLTGSSQAKASPAPSTPITTGVPAHVPNGPKPDASLLHSVSIPSSGLSSSQLSASAVGPHMPVIKPEGAFVPAPKPGRPAKRKASFSTPTAPEPPPGSKEAMARKRDFSELVDLTQLSDNEDYVMSRWHARIESPSPEADPLRAFQFQGAAAQQDPLAAFMGAPGPGMSALPQPMPLKFDPIQPSAASPSTIQQTSKTILAKSVNKGEALRKSYYDPKTVARDILIAAGRHPIERPLNAHMAGLLGKHIELDSDLSTFDWDAIDPGGPPVPKVPYVEIPAAPPRFKLGERGERRVQVASINTDKDKNSRLPEQAKRDPEPAPAPLNSLVRFSVQTRRLLEESRVNQEDRPPRLRHSLGVNHAVPQPQASTPLKRKASVLSNDPSPNAPPSRLNSVDSKTMESGSFWPSGKRRGRPPGAKNKHPSVTAMRNAARPTPEITIPIRAPSPPGQPVFRCRWKGCKGSLHNLPTLRQHVAKVHYPAEDEPNVCWWRNCEHLQRDEDGSIVATKSFPSWEECITHIDEDHLHQIGMKYGDGPSTDHIGKQKSLVFDVSKFVYDPSFAEPDARTVSYLDPQTITQDKARYLSDERGRSTTPSVSMKSNKDLPADTLTLPKAHDDEADAVAHKSFLKTHRHEKINPKISAEETLRAMVARKQQIGPGLERGGCTLVNEARRATLIQNQGLQRVVDENY